MGDVGQDGRRVEGALPGGLAAGEHLGAGRDGLVDVALDDADLGVGGHRAQVVGEAGVGLAALLQLADVGGQFRHELVVHRRLDVDPLDGYTDLAGVEERPPGDAVGGPVQIGVGQHDGRVLAAEFQAARDQPLSAGRRHLLAGGGGTGELNHVAHRGHRRTGGPVTGGQRHHRRGADLVPAADELHRRQRGHLGGLEQNRAACGQRRRHVKAGHREREVPRGDHTDQWDRPVGDGELLDLPQRAVRRDVLVRHVLLGVTGPVVDHVGDGDGLEVGIHPGFTGLRHQHIGDVVGVVEDPLLPLEHPLLATFGADGLPLGLEQAQFSGLGGDGLGVVNGHRAGNKPGGGVVHGDAVGLRLHCGHRRFLPKVAFLRC